MGKQGVKGPQGPKGPWKYKKDYHPRAFIELSRQGKCLAQIARDWDVARETIYEWARKYKNFSDSMKKGQQLCEAWYIELGQAAMLGNAKTKDGQKIKVELGFYIWMTKNICKWSDKVESKNEHVSARVELVDSEDEKIVLPKNGFESKE